MNRGYLAVAGLLAVLAAACGHKETEAVDGAGGGAADAWEATAEAAPLYLVADRTVHEFGDVPIDGGVVETVYNVRNDAAEEVRLAAVYSSCMCTTAVLEFADGTSAGPFGMPGHELPTTIERTLAAGEQFRVRVQFDPAAHGPEGVGPTRRAVAIHTANGAMLQLDLTANVIEGS